MYVKREDAQKRIDSAIELARAMLAVHDKVRKENLKQLLNVCIWQLSEAEPDHKHRTRYQSVAVEKEVSQRKGRWDSTDLRHDHVFERKRLVNDLLVADEEAKINEEAAQKKFDEVFAKAAVACTVMREQHDDQLKGAEGYGWKRYQSAKIEIVDTLTGWRGVPNVEDDSVEPFKD